MMDHLVGNLIQQTLAGAQLFAPTTVGFWVIQLPSSAMEVGLAITSIDFIQFFLLVMQKMFPIKGYQGGN